MTTTAATSTHPSVGSGRTSRLAALGIALACAATAVGTFADLSGNDSKGPDDDAKVYLITVGIIVVIAALAYGLGVRGAAGGKASRRAAVLGVLAAVSFVVFWTGAPLVLASASVACALIDRDRLGSFGTGSKVGLVASALAAAAAVLLAVVG